MFDTIKYSLETAQKLGIWNLLTFLSILFSSLLAYRYLFYSKRNIQNLNFNKFIFRDNSNYPLKIIIEIRNYTGKSVVIKDTYFILKKFKPDPKASMDKITGKIEIKFPTPDKTEMNEIDYFIPHNENITTWIPLDPNQSYEEIEKTLKNSYIGKFYGSYIWISDNPKFQKLERNV